MTDLTDRMRTCAAHILANDAHDRDDGAGLVLRDAAALLIEASNELVNAAECLERGAYDLRLGGYLRSASILEEEAAKTIPPDTQLGTPMPIIPPGNQMAADRIQPLPYAEGLFAATERSSRACPKCESRGARTVRRQGNQVMLQCPVCGEQWEWKRNSAG